MYFWCASMDDQFPSNKFDYKYWHATTHDVQVIIELKLECNNAYIVDVIIRHQINKTYKIKYCMYISK